MAKTFTGKTENAESPFLSGAWWKPEVKVRGVVKRCYVSANGPCYVLTLEKPVEIDGAQETQVSIGNLTGFNMALVDANQERLFKGDIVTVTCTGVKLPSVEGQSPRPNFMVEIVRP